MPEAGHAYVQKAMSRCTEQGLLLEDARFLSGRL